MIHLERFSPSPGLNVLLAVASKTFFFSRFQRGTAPRQVLAAPDGKKIPGAPPVRELLRHLPCPYWGETAANPLVLSVVEACNFAYPGEC